MTARATPRSRRIPTVAGRPAERRVARRPTPAVEMQFAGVDGAFNSLSRTGVDYPIDAGPRSRGFRSAFAAATAFPTPTTWSASSTGRTRAAPAAASSCARRAGPTRAAPTPTCRRSASQPGSGYQIFRIDLDAASPLQGGVSWSGIMRGLQVRLAQSGTAQGATFDSTGCGSPSAARVHDPPAAVERLRRTRRADGRRTRRPATSSRFIRMAAASTSPTTPSTTGTTATCRRARGR